MPVKHTGMPWHEAMTPSVPGEALGTRTSDAQPEPTQEMLVNDTANKGM